MSVQPDFPLRILYDGGCSVCAAAIEGYARRDGGERLVLVDINDADFDAAVFGLRQEELLYQLHVIDREGSVYRGVEALRVIWQVFPSSSMYGLLGQLLALPPVRPLARLGYWCFARLRRFLPKAQSSCRIGRNRRG